MSFSLSSKVYPVNSYERFPEFTLRIMEFNELKDEFTDEAKDERQDLVILDVIENISEKDFHTDSGVGKSIYSSHRDAEGGCDSPVRGDQTGCLEFVRMWLANSPTESFPFHTSLTTCYSWPHTLVLQNWIESNISHTGGDGRDPFLAELTLFAVRSGNESLLEALMNLGLLHPSEQLMNNLTAMQTACIWRNLTALIKLGCLEPEKVIDLFVDSIDPGYCKSISPLDGSLLLSSDLSEHLAAFYNEAEVTFPLLSILLHERQKTAKDALFWNELFVSVVEHGQEDFTDFLIRACGGDLNVQRTKDSWTPLHIASSSGRLSLFKLLLERGANTNLSSLDYQLPEEVCPKELRHDFTKVLLPFRELRLNRLKTELSRGVVASDLSVVDLSMVQLDGQPLILAAAACVDSTVLEVLLKLPNAPINAQDCHNGNSLLINAAISTSLPCISVLVKCGANASLRNFDGLSALDVAVQNNAVQTVNCLLQYQECWSGLPGTMKRAKAPEILQSLKEAFRKRQMEIVKPALFAAALGEFCYLGVLEKGDNLNIQNETGETPVVIAIKKGHLDALKVFVEYGADFWTPFPKTLDTTLHIAAEHGRAAVVRFLVHEARRMKIVYKLDEINCGGKTPLYLAADAGSTDTVKTLLDLGAACTGFYRDGMLRISPLESVQAQLDFHRLPHQAAVFRALEKADLSALKSIWQPKLDHYLRNNIGDTPLMIAAQTSSVKVLDFLLESAVHDFRPLGPEVEMKHDGNVDYMLRHKKPPPDYSDAPASIYQFFAGRRKLTSFQWIFGNTENSTSTCVPTLFTTEYTLNHVSAVNVVDGSCALHRVIEVGDNVEAARRLVKVDPFCINIQEHNGFSSLHLAVILRRRRILNFLLQSREMDFYATDLFGRLAEELVETPQMMERIHRARTVPSSTWATMCDEQIPLSTADGISDWTRQFENVDSSNSAGFCAGPKLSMLKGNTSASQDGLYEFLEKKAAVEQKMYQEQVSIYTGTGYNDLMRLGYF